MFVVVFLSLFVFDFIFLRVCPLGLYRFHFRPRFRNRFSDCDSDCGFDLDSDFVFDSFSLKISFWTFLCNLGSAIGFINSRAQGPRTEHAVGGGPCPRCGRGGHVYGQVRVYFWSEQIYKSRGQVPRPLPHRTRGSMRKTAQKRDPRRKKRAHHTPSTTSSASNPAFEAEDGAKKRVGRCLRTVLSTFCVCAPNL